MQQNFFILFAQHLWNATRYSWAGLKIAWRHHWAFRQEVLISIFALPLAWYLGNSPIEKVLLLGSWILVLIVEILNSAIETAIDRISLERHELSKQAKDLGSAAVFLAGLNALLVWGIICLAR